MVLRGALITQTSVRQLMQPGTHTSLKVVLSYSDDNIMVLNSKKNLTSGLKCLDLLFSKKSEGENKYNKICLFSEEKQEYCSSKIAYFISRR